MNYQNLNTNSELENYQKNSKAKKIINTLSNLWGFYLAQFIAILLAVIICNVQSNQLQDLFNQIQTSQTIAAEFWIAATVFIIIFIALEGSGIALAIQIKKLNEMYPENIKNYLAILFLIGLFIFITSLIAIPITIFSYQKITKEIKEQEKNSTNSLI